MHCYSYDVISILAVAAFYKVCVHAKLIVAFNGSVLNPVLLMLLTCSVGW